MSVEEFQIIHERNQRVERDKAWERSYTRRFLIAAITYFIAMFFLMSAGHKDPWLHALVPACGYILSTLSLPLAKDIWLKYCYRKSL